jgi:UDP-glucuronate 4-epimerase
VNDDRTAEGRRSARNLGRVLVTGAAGFIGSHLVDRLLSVGCEVVGVDCFTSYYARELKEANLERAKGCADGRFCFVEGDLLGLDLRRVLGGVDAIAHLAAEPGVRGSFGERFPVYAERNVLATRRLLEAAAGAGVGHFVYASSSSIYGSDGGRPIREDDPLRPVSPYGLTKLAAEALVGLYAEKGLPATILRYFTVYGPRQRPEMALSSFTARAARGEPVEVYGNGDQIREMTYVSDAVAATVAALDKPPQDRISRYNVGGGERATVRDLVGLVEDALGKKVVVRYGASAPGDVRSTWADLGRAARELGYEPQVGVEAGVRAQVAWAARRRAIVT